MTFEEAEDLLTDIMITLNNTTEEQEAALCYVLRKSKDTIRRWHLALVKLDDCVNVYKDSEKLREWLTYLDKKFEG